MNKNPQITVLYYHEVVPNGQGHTYQKIGVDKFEAQLRCLKSKGFECVDFDELKSGKCPKKPLVITFDDGFKSVYDYAVPLLKKYGMKAVSFLPCKYIDEGHPYYMSWDNIKELVNENIISVGAHTYSHIDIRRPTSEELRNEIKKCNDSIYGNLGIKPSSICFPYGTFNSSSVKTIRQCGDYTYLVASFFGKTRFNKLKRKLVQRIGISDVDSMEMFERKISGKENYRGIVHLLRILSSNIKKKYVIEYRIDF